jgi:hypothetical protein
MTNVSDVISVWRLRANYWEIVQSGERIEPFGAQPKGVFMIHPDGRVVVNVHGREPIGCYSGSPAFRSSAISRS